MRWGKWGQVQNYEGQMCDANGYEYQELWLWMIQLSRNDSERQKQGKTVTQGAWMDMYDGSKCQN